VADSALCVDCRLQAPEDRDASLVSFFGWRLIRTRTRDGNMDLEWRCPPCWERYKATRGPVGNTMRPPSAGTPPTESEREAAFRAGRRAT
jgi:hypothetical protein